MVERRLHENKNAELKELNAARFANVAMYIAFPGGYIIKKLVWKYEFIRIHTNKPDA
ncbi:hypothetical protein VAEU17_4280118 [Vibrio aestuarianus]|nr:hypothetical protein VAEU17_4280118 [Vibrio aestuarianus]